MGGQHSGVVHTVDVVAGENEDIVRIKALNEGDVLVDGVGSTLVPLRFFAPGVRRKHLSAAMGFVKAPGLAIADVFVQLQGLILRENAHGINPGVDAVGQREINDTVLTAEGYGRLGGVFRQNLQPAALATGQQHGNAAFFLKIHGSPLLYNDLVMEME